MRAIPIALASGLTKVPLLPGRRAECSETCPQRRDTLSQGFAIALDLGNQFKGLSNQRTGVPIFLRHEAAVLYPAVEVPRIRHYRCFAAASQMLDRQVPRGVSLRRSHAASQMPRNFLPAPQKHIQILCENSTIFAANFAPRALPGCPKWSISAAYTESSSPGSVGETVFVSHLTNIP